MAVTDDERREVAARLRKAIGLTEFAEVLGFNWTDDSDWVWNDVSNLVADLIEPAQDHFADSGKKVDRDALLALADEIEYGASSDDGEYHDLPATMVAAVARKQMEYARRIREACGEEGA